MLGSDYEAWCKRADIHLGRIHHGKAYTNECGVKEVAVYDIFVVLGSALVVVVR